MKMNTTYTYQPICGLTRLLKILLVLGAAMAVVSMLSSFMQAELLSRGSFSEAEAQANDLREQAIGLLQLALYLFTVVIFGVWIVRANKNVRALGASDLPITPGWAVGYFFIPILNLWRPYQAMKDLWRASHNPASWGVTAAGPVLPIWWALWLISGFLGQLSFRVTMNADSLEALQVATYLQIGEQVVDIPLCLAAVSLVGQIAAAQRSHVGMAGDGSGQWSCG